MAGFLRVPLDGLQICRSMEERGMVSDLSELANQKGWGPFMASDGYLQARWGATQNKVRRMIADLVAAGVLDIVDPGCRTRPRIVQMRDRGVVLEQPPVQPPAATTPASTGVLFERHKKDRHQPPGKPPGKPPGSTEYIDIDIELEIEEKKKGSRDKRVDIVCSRWEELSNKLLVPTRKGIERVIKADRKGKYSTELLIQYVEWLLTSNDDKPTFLRSIGKTHGDTPWTEKHFENYLDLMQNPPSGFVLPSAGPKQAPTNEIATIVKKVMAIPNHLAPNYRESIAALGPLAPELKAIGGGTWGGLQENITNNFTRRATEQAIRELLEKK